jgi:hypothetical protein
MIVAQLRRFIEDMDTAEWLDVCSFQLVANGQKVLDFGYKSLKKEFFFELKSPEIGVLSPEVSQWLKDINDKHPPFDPTTWIPPSFRESGEGDKWMGLSVTKGW